MSNANRHYTESHELAMRLHFLGIPDPKAVILHAAEAGMVQFPVPVAKPSQLRPRPYVRHNFATQKERNDYYYQQAKLRAMERDGDGAGI